jgi:hypothetical protein
VEGVGGEGGSCSAFHISFGTLLKTSVHNID